MADLGPRASPVDACPASDEKEKKEQKKHEEERAAKRRLHVKRRGQESLQGLVMRKRRDEARDKNGKWPRVTQ